MCCAGIEEGNCVGCVKSLTTNLQNIYFKSTLNKIFFDNLNETNLGYITSRNQKLTYLLFMDGLKLYAKNGTKGFYLM